MPKWASIVLIIIVFFVVADYVERRRVTAMDAWRQAHGFRAIDPFVPAEHQPVLALASLATLRDSSGLPWAGVLTGVSNGTRVTFAELSYSPNAGQTSKWFTLAVWPEPTANKAPNGWPHSGRFVRIDGYAGWLTEGLLTPGRADELLGQIEGARRAMAGGLQNSMTQPWAPAR